MRVKYKEVGDYAVIFKHFATFIEQIVYMYKDVRNFGVFLQEQ